MSVRHVRRESFTREIFVEEIYAALLRLSTAYALRNWPIVFAMAIEALARTDGPLDFCPTVNRFTVAAETPYDRPAWHWQTRAPRAA